MVNYKNGKIYKLVNSVATEGNCYYGSTCNELKSRKYNHKTKYHCWKNGKQHYISSFKLFEQDFENVKVILVEYFPCDNKQELHTRERFWIENNPCLNKRIPGRTRKEIRKNYRDKNIEKIKLKEKEFYKNNKEKFKKYYENNKEKIKIRKKKYYENNKERIRQKIECPICKEYICRDNIRRHQKGKKCQSFKKN